MCVYEEVRLNVIMISVLVWGWRCLTYHIRERNVGFEVVEVRQGGQIYKVEV